VLGVARVAQAVRQVVGADQEGIHGSAQRQRVHVGNGLPGLDLRDGGNASALAAGDVVDDLADRLQLRFRFPVRHHQRIDAAVEVAHKDLRLRGFAAQHGRHAVAVGAAHERGHVFDVHGRALAVDEQAARAGTRQSVDHIEAGAARIDGPHRAGLAEQRSKP
jgi:hypothetical protein